MKFSVVTVALNSSATIAETIESVSVQRGVEIEHIVVDGGSTDGTQAIVESYGHHVARFVSEPDNGIYDAMNKGINLATGDVVGILNSDDVYPNSTTLLSVAREFITSSETVIVMGHVDFISTSGGGRIVRRYRSARFMPWMMRFGWMPPHPATFIRREAYENYGTYRIDYRISADYELLVRLLVVHRLKYSRIDRTLAVMRMGGLSTSGLRSSVILNREIVRACRSNGVPTSLVLVLTKVPFKLLERLRLR